ncbi:hypothetical protein KSB_06410 [Ktedonobacter robiniae]|uniref:Transposase n=1 Tax=Ktedonobacter robiniae TaxID=2778365 RepID=A0ABQ3UHF9_9CHLR|nr:hypothetical protein KSB_06410 [Ktedonobacter robiniae]
MEHEHLKAHLPKKFPSAFKLSEKREEVLDLFILVLTHLTMFNNH